MAKITPSALVSEITGKINGHVLQMWKGQITLKRFTPTRQPRTFNQTRIRRYLSNFAGRWYSLSSGNQAAWATYADALPDVMTPANAFSRNNMRLLYADHTDLTEIDAPPDPPDPPTAPAGFGVSYDAGDDEFDLEWSTPDHSDFYIQGFYSPQAGYRNRTSLMWNFIETVQSTDKVIHMDVSAYDAPRFFAFRLRVIDCTGEISTWTETERWLKS